MKWRLKEHEVDEADTFPDPQLRTLACADGLTAEDLFTIESRRIRM